MWKSLSFACGQRITQMTTSRTPARRDCRSAHGAQVQACDRRPTLKAEPAEGAQTSKRGSRSTEVDVLQPPREEVAWFYKPVRAGALKFCTSSSSGHFLTKRCTPFILPCLFIRTCEIACVRSVTADESEPRNRRIICRDQPRDECLSLRYRCATTQRRRDQ